MKSGKQPSLPGARRWIRLALDNQSRSGLRSDIDLRMSHQGPAAVAAATVAGRGLPFPNGITPAFPRP